MKILHLFFFFVFSVILVSSCQKELDFEDIGGPSSGTLKKDTSDCLPSTVSGEYTTDSALTSQNYIDVQVDVRFPGSYLIYSDTINGISFRDAGTFGTIGLTTVRLSGTGTPVLAGTHSYIIRYDTSVCIIDVDVQPSGVDAVYTFGGAGGTCTGTVLSGSYMEGTALTASNTAEVDVAITSTGNYSISTTQVNGVTFTASGVFNDLSQATVTLTAQGTPLAAGTFNFALLGNGVSCAFSVTFDPPAGPAVFTLGGSPNNCTGVVLGGTYQVAVPMNTSNTATFDVDVTTAGTYTISTDTLNGISFSASGLFSSTGPQTISLSAAGTPVATGPFNYTVNGAGSTCSFSVNF